MGGLGIRRASSLALPAFLASAASTLPLQTFLSLLTSINLIPDTYFQDMTSEWCSKSDFNDGDSMPTHKQALWDRPLLHCCSRHSKRCFKIQQTHTTPRV